jgi:uncharacterized protein (DUF2147 family)
MLGTHVFHKLCRALVVAALVCAFAGAAWADPQGLWLAKDGAQVKIAPCGGALCGVLATTSSPTDPATGQPWTDKHNVDPSLRGRPLLGLPVLTGMQPAGYGKWSGQLYNIDDGKTYRGNIIELNATTIKVEGCVLIICGGENMTRLK